MPRSAHGLSVKARPSLCRSVGGSCVMFQVRRCPQRLREASAPPMGVPRAPPRFPPPPGLLLRAARDRRVGRSRFSPSFWAFPEGLPCAAMTSRTPTGSGSGRRPRAAPGLAALGRLFLNAVLGQAGAVPPGGEPAQEDCPELLGVRPRGVDPGLAEPTATTCRHALVATFCHSGGVVDGDDPDAVPQNAVGGGVREPWHECRAGVPGGHAVAGRVVGDRLERAVNGQREVVRAGGCP